MAEARRLVEVAGGDTESAAERLFVDLLRAEEITGWQPQYRVGKWPVDFAWPTERIAVEIDGWAYHQQQRHFERDHRKRNDLVQAGWIVLSYTWHQLNYEVDESMRLLAESLAARRAELH